VPVLPAKIALSKIIIKTLQGSDPQDPIKNTITKNRLKILPAEIGGAEIDSMIGAKAEILPSRPYMYPARDLHNRGAAQMLPGSGLRQRLRERIQELLDELQRMNDAAQARDLSDLDGDLLVQTMVWNFFIDKGFTEAQVAGIMGNVFQESSWNPLRRETGSSFWGLFQISNQYNPLADGLEERFREAGLDISRFGYDVSTYQGIDARHNIPREYLERIVAIQLEYIYTLRPTAQDWETPLRNATTPEEAAEVFVVRYLGAINTRDTPREGDRLLYHEASHSYWQNVDARRGFARRYYDEFAR